MDKIKVSQDTLYQYLTEHNLTISVFARKMGVSDGIVHGCFHHDLNRHGQPLKFSAANIERLNVALTEVADELRKCILIFGGPETFTNQRGTTYDPGLATSIRNGASRYFKIIGLTERLLGWNKAKSNTTLSVKSSPMYGRITKADADRINAELLSVAGVLSSYEVVADESPAQTAETKTDKKQKDKRTEDTSDYSWDDPNLLLMEDILLNS